MTRYLQAQSGQASRMVACGLALLALARALPAQERTAPAALPPPSTGVIGFTAPLRTITLAPLRTGRIAKLLVDEGEFIEGGKPAVLLDDTVQRHQVEIARAQAASTLEADLARVRMEQAAAELKRIEALARSTNASSKELADARANARAAELTWQEAVFKHEQAQRQYALQQAMLDELHLKAPFSGYVAQRHKDVGDTVEEREGVLTLVQLDPLVVMLDCPLELASVVRAGRAVRVLPLDTGLPPRTGEVYFVSRVADPASQTFKVKVRVPNADTAWVAGLRVRVDFPAPAATAHTEGVHNAGK